MIRKPLKDRLFAKVKMAESGCWEWTAAKSVHGYGHIRDAGVTKKAHRVSFEIHHGPIPEGHCVCHRCDNPGCINPDHLFAASQTENIADMDKKGRRGDQIGQKAGTSHPLAKLTDADVIAIRSARGVTQRSLARQYGVSFAQICRIISGVRWGSVKPHSQPQK